MGMAAADLVSLLRAGQLLEAEQLAEAARLQTFFADAKALAGDLIQRGWLTPFQANLLLQGRGQDLLLGSYVLLERLGEGGMGTVYKARQRSLGRIVAVKVIRKDRVVNPQAVKRFQREIRAAAQLDHPNIVRAFDADEIAGTLLLVMEYVENGTDLSQIVKRDGPLPIATACDYIRQAALGLQHAHERGLVHRDIKPQNLLVVSEAGGVVSEAGGVVSEAGGVVSEAGGVVSGRVVSGKEDGTTHHSPTHHSPLTTHQVKILDMGLALLEHPEDGGKSSTSLTGEGTVMGTVDYIAPEQAMDSHHVDIRADLYSLGCTFYYLLTGRVPFPGGDAVGKLIRQQTEEPEPFEMLRPEISPALAAIVRKLMAKRKEERFQTPGELAVALEQAVKQGVESRTHGSEASRQKARSVSVSGTAVDPKLARQWAEVVTPSSETEALVKPPVQFSAPGKPLPWRWLVGSGAAALVLLILVLWQPWRRGGDGPTSDANVTKRKPKPPSADELAEQAERKRQAEAEEALKPLAARMVALGAGASPAGEALRKDLREFLMKHSATPAATKACDLLGQVLAKLPSPLDKLDPAKIPAYELEVARRTAGGSLPLQALVAILGDSRLKHWAEVRAVAFSPDGKTLASGSADGTVKLWDPATGSELRTLKGHAAQVASVAFSPDGKTLASASYDQTVKLWDPAAGSELRALKGHIREVDSVAFTPDGKTLASGSPDGTLKLWDRATGSEFRTLKEPGRVVSVAFSPDGKTLASGCADNTVKLWDLAAGSELRTLKGHTGFVISVTFSPDSKTLASGSYDGTVKLWDPAAGSELRTLKGHTNWVYSVAFSPDGKTLASASQDGTVKLWDSTAGSELRTLKGHTNWVYSVAFSPDGKTLASGSDDRTVKLWDVETGKEVQPLTGPVGPVRSVVFAPDDSFALASGQDGGVWRWDAKADGPWRRLSCRSGTNVVLLSSEKAVSGDGGNLFLWDTDTGKEVESFRAHDDTITSVAVSWDGRRVLSGGYDKAMRLWDVANRKEIRRFDHPGPVGSIACWPCVAFSPDGRKGLSGSGTDIRLWDLETGSELGRFVVDRVDSVAFSPGGQHFAYGGYPLWLNDILAGKPKEPISRENRGAIAWMGFAPDGKTLACADTAGGIQLWDTVSVAKPRESQLPGPVHGLALAADGRHLATANGNGTVYIFRLADGPPRALSPEEAKKQQEDEAKQLGVPVQIENSIGMKLSLIPAGRFLMGSPENEPDRSVREGPQHDVTISKPFYMGIYEVTQAQFEKVAGNNPSGFDMGNGGSPDNPVEMVSWEDAVAFCSKLSALPDEQKSGRIYRLPTEAEWEYACRAGSQTAYSFGDDPALVEQYGWYAKNSGGKTHRVGQLKSNTWGLYDIHGNVWEWVADAFDDEYYKRSPVIDPKGPPANGRCLARGGSLVDAGQRSASRNGAPAPLNLRQKLDGFRIVCEIRPPQITNCIGMKLARIPAGKFLMGSPDNEPGRQANEGPQHEVTITKPFHIGVYEVTQEQYEKVTGKNPSTFNKDNGGGADHPVEMVSWDEAVAFCKKLSELPEETKTGRVYRLPTEAEWEYACRAGTKTAYSFGDDAKEVEQYAWAGPGGNNRTHAVGHKKPNRWGLYDTHGNVWEWCGDFFDPNNYRISPATNLQGVKEGDRLLRGGSAYPDDLQVSWCRSARRHNVPPTVRQWNVGFRVVSEMR